MLSQFRSLYSVSFDPSCAAEIDCPVILITELNKTSTLSEEVQEIYHYLPLTGITGFTNSDLDNTTVPVFPTS